MLKKILLGCFMVCGNYVTVKAQVALPWPQVTRDSRPWVRWWWLGNAVDTPGIKYSLDKFHKAGIGGVEIAPIYGTKGFENKFIDFLSPGWMKMLHYTINEADRNEMGVDITTGSGWPFGGPQVPLKGAASKALFQVYELQEGENQEQPIIATGKQQMASLQALMAYSNQGEKIDITDKVDQNGRLHWKAPAGDWKLIALFNGKTFQKVKRASPGGEGWVMNPFSANALAIYLKPFTEAFAKSKCPPPHAFFNDSYEVFGANWTDDLFNEFKTRRGYKLQDYLPALTGEGNKDTVTRVIADYRQTLSEMLLENFTRKWTGWAHKQGSITRNQAHGSPGNLLDLYGTVDIPEIESFGSSHFDIKGLPEDSLGERPGKLDPLLLKFASSAAHVAGKKYTSSETFTWLGEHFRVSLSQCKPLLDQMWLAGINHVFFHGIPYSPKDAPWPGWQFYAAVNFSPYNTIWHDMPAFNNYIARGQSFLQSGFPDNDVLVYWPVQDVWAQQNKSIIYQLTIGNATQWLSPTSFHAVCEQLMNDGYSFDYISDHFLEKTKVENGLLQTPGASYKALVIPPCKYIPEETLKRIMELAHKGAKIIFVKSLPEDVPGLDDLHERRLVLEKLKNEISPAGRFTNNVEKDYGSGKLFTGNEIDGLLKMAGIPSEEFTSAGLQYIRRKGAEGVFYFIANLQPEDVDQWIPLSEKISAAAIYDPYSGKSGMAMVREKNGHSEIYLQLKSGQSLVLKTFINKIPGANRWAYAKEKGFVSPLKGRWKISFEQGGPAIHKQYEMDTLTSWTGLSDSAKVFAGTVKYTLNFTLPDYKADDWLLDLGRVDFSADVTVNGQKVASLWAVPFEVRIGKYLKSGKNTLEVEVTNLAANRISDYDRRKIFWKKFYEINFVTIGYKPFDASGWMPVSSGLIGPVTLHAISHD